MTAYYLPVVIIIASNVFYNICAKSMPIKANPFFCLVITYIIAAIVALVMYLTASGEKIISDELQQLNWAPFVLGFSLVALEFGYILLYRMGWNVSIGSLVCNILLAILLLFIGLLLYREILNGRQILGILFCLAGLFCINQ